MCDGLALANNLSLGNTEGDSVALADTVFTLRKVAGLVKAKLVWLGESPYLLANIIVEEVAQQIAEQWNAVRPSAHHRKTQAIIGSYLPHIMDIAAGRDVEPPRGW